jgi:hypothetical protein
VRAFGQNPAKPPQVHKNIICIHKLYVHRKRKIKITQFWETNVAHRSFATFFLGSKCCGPLVRNILLEPYPQGNMGCEPLVRNIFWETNAANRSFATSSGKPLCEPLVRTISWETDAENRSFTISSGTQLLRPARSVANRSFGSSRWITKGSRNHTRVKFRGASFCGGDLLGNECCEPLVRNIF